MHVGTEGTVPGVEWGKELSLLVEERSLPESRSTRADAGGAQPVTYIYWKAHKKVYHTLRALYKCRLSLPVYFLWWYDRLWWATCIKRHTLIRKVTISSSCPVPTVPIDVSCCSSSLPCAKSAPLMSSWPYSSSRPCSCESTSSTSCSGTCSGSCTSCSGTCSCTSCSGGTTGSTWSSTSAWATSTWTWAASTGCEVAFCLQWVTIIIITALKCVNPLLRW